MVFNNPSPQIWCPLTSVSKIELVCEDKDGLKSLAYGNMNAILVKAIQEQQEQIEELKQIINTLVESK